jgi:chorismate dehydratase
VVTTLAHPQREGAADAGGRPAVLRLGAVSYLNAEPLVYGLDDQPRFELERDVPSRVAERLHRGETDLGMIPSIEYAFGDYAIVPGIAIGSRGAVRSVNLYHRGEVEDVRRVAVDTSSRASVALLKVLLRERLGRDPEYMALPPDPERMRMAADAFLMIGDPALYLKSEMPRIDLGQEWFRVTGLPFVYAFWAGPRGPVSAGDVGRLQAALSAGLAAVDEIAARYHRQGRGQAAENASYLRANVSYRLGDDEVAGLREFYRRAHAQGLIPRLPEIVFHAQA